MTPEDLLYENRTDFRDEHVAAFIAEVVQRELGDHEWARKTFWSVEFSRGKTPYGRGEEGGTIACLYLDRHGSVDKVELAHTIAHECAHLRGLTHDDMEGDPRYDNQTPSWRDLYKWAEDLPLERREFDPSNPADAFNALVIAEQDRRGGEK